MSTTTNVNYLKHYNHKIKGVFVYNFFFVKKSLFFTEKYLFLNFFIEAEENSF